MSFISSIKRVLGFGGDDSADDDDQLYADTEPADTEPADSASTPAAQQLQTDLTPVEFNPDVQQAMLRGIVDYINSQFPSFISATTDREAQSRMLFDILDADIKTYIASVSSVAQAYCEARWNNHKTSLSAEIEAMKQRAGELEKRSNDVKQKQLSADRQRRALTERVHDLETQIARLESEREQFELENRSLVNRVKVSNVLQDDIDKLRDENKELQARIEQLISSPEAAVADRMDTLKQEIEDLKAQNDQHLQTIAEMTSGIESLKEQLRVTDEMRDDLRKRLFEIDTTAKHSAREASEALKKTTDEVLELKGLIDQRDAKIVELETLLKEYDNVTARMAEVDKVLTRYDKKVKKQEAIIADRDAEIERLNKSIIDNIEQHNERERRLKAEIQAMRPPTVVSEMQINFDAVPEDDAPRISEDEILAIEETFESGEWFTNTPPAETPSMRPAESEADFGYHAPRRRSNQTHNPDQLSLF